MEQWVRGQGGRRGEVRGNEERERESGEGIVEQ